MPTPQRRIRARLQSPGDVKSELGKLYRAAKAGTIDSQVALRLSGLLREWLKAHEICEIEKRLAALEARAVARDRWRPPEDEPPPPPTSTDSRDSH